LEIAIPKGKSNADLIKRYDENLGFPTANMVTEMKDSVTKIKSMNTYEDWFNVSNIYHIFLEVAPYVIKMVPFVLFLCYLNCVVTNLLIICTLVTCI